METVYKVINESKSEYELWSATKLSKFLETCDTPFTGGEGYAPDNLVEIAWQMPKPEGLRLITDVMLKYNPGDCINAEGTFALIKAFTTLRYYYEHIALSLDPKEDRSFIRLLHKNNLLTKVHVGDDDIAIFNADMLYRHLYHKYIDDPIKAKCRRLLHSKNQAINSRRDVVYYRELASIKNRIFDLGSRFFYLNQPIPYSQVVLQANIPPFDEWSKKFPEHVANTIRAVNKSRLF